MTNINTFQGNVFIPDGNVGIGTTSTNAILEVYGPDLTGQSVGTTSLLSRHVADDDGVLNTFGIVTSNGGETMGCLLYTSPSPRDRG